ncbi:MAG: response regulator [Candidatus Paceibacterota bacterium]
MTEPQPDQKPIEGKEQLNIKVLLVDDDPSILGLSKRSLEGMGCTVETAINGQEALDKIFNSDPGEFGLVISDKEMPKVGGIETLKRIHTDERFKDLPMILYSGALTPDDEKAVEVLGGSCLKKPFTLDKFKTTVLGAVRKP